MENLIDFYGHKIEDGTGKALRLYDEYGVIKSHICFYRKNPKEKIVECYCPTTDGTFEIKYAELGKKKMSEYTCPNECCCEQSGCKFYNANRAHKGLNVVDSFGYFEKCDGGVVFRGYNIKIDYSVEWCSGNFDEAGCYPLYRRGDISAKEVKRVFYGEKGNVEHYSRLYRGYYGFYTSIGEWRKKKNVVEGDLYKYLGDVKSDLNGTILEGIVKYAEKFNDVQGGVYIESLADIYAMLWKYAGVRRLVEYGFYECVRDYTESVLMRDHVVADGFYMRRNTIKGVLNVEPNIFNGVDKSVLPLRSVRSIAAAYRDYGIYPTKENVDAVLHYGFYKIAQIANDATTMRKILKYVRMQNRKNADVNFSIYYDYIVTAERLNFDFKNKEVLFPKDLMRAHDRVKDFYKVVGSVVKLKDFKNAVAKYTGVAYADKEKYVEVVATPYSLSLWAKKFDNCSYGYCDRIINGKCVIFLVRLKAFPEYPCCMFEVDTQDLRLVQARGVNNRKVSKEIVEFVDGFVAGMRAG